MRNKRNGDNKNVSLSAGCCSNENFVDIVLIIADFYCIANKEKSKGYANVCNMLAIHISGILQVPLHPYNDFEHFRTVYQNPDSDLAKRFAAKLQAIDAEPTSFPWQSPERQLKFDEICIEIENRHIAGKLAAAVLSLLEEK